MADGYLEARRGAAIGSENGRELFAALSSPQGQPMSDRSWPVALLRTLVAAAGSVLDAVLRMVRDSDQRTDKLRNGPKTAQIVAQASVRSHCVLTPAPEQVIIRVE